MPEKTKTRSMSFEGGLRRILRLSRDKGLCVNKVMHILWDPEFLLVCHWKIRSKPGNISRGIDQRTFNEINQKLI
jgi:hypothetical protein